MRLIFGFIIASACFGQGAFNLPGTGVFDAHSMVWRFPESTYAALPSPGASNAGWRYTVTDCLTTACTVGGGTIVEDLRSDGVSLWVVVSGAGSSNCDTSIFTSIGLGSSSVSCASGLACISGTVAYNNAAFNAASPGANVAAFTLPAKYHLVAPWPIVEETTQATSGTVTGAGVSMGTSGNPYQFLARFAVMLASNSGGNGMSWDAASMRASATGTTAVVFRLETTDGANVGNGSATNFSAGLWTARACAAGGN